MKKLSQTGTFNNFFFQFVLFIILNTSFSILIFLVARIFHLNSPDAAYPLGADYGYILYNNFLKALTVVVTLYFFRTSFLGVTRNTLLRLVLFGSLVYVLNGFIQYGIAMIDGRTENPIRILWSPSGAMAFRIISVFAAIGVYAWTDREHKRQTEKQAKELELSVMRELKTKAELDSLHAKVNPHFLYNALNSIHTLVDQDQEKAKEMIHLLSRLFRLSISMPSGQFHTLKEELELVKTYLLIEKVRFQERLKFEIICDEQLLDSMVPRFLLQPLAENAIKHGTSKLADAGHVMVVVKRVSDFLEIQVRDNGPAFSEQLQNGHGLKSVSDKIRLLGADGSEFEIVAGSDDTPPIAGPWKYVGIKFKMR